MENDHVVAISVGIADAATWEVALEHIRDVSLIKERIEEMRHQNASPEDAERIEKRLEEVRTRMNNLVKIGMAAQDEEVLASVTRELHLLETEKRDCKRCWQKLRRTKRPLPS